MTEHVVIMCWWLLITCGRRRLVRLVTVAWSLFSHKLPCEAGETLNKSALLFALAAVQQPLSLPEGEITTIEIHRSNPYIQLGISIVGGNETPLINIVIQEVYRDGVIARDGRLLAGDQILQVTTLPLYQLVPFCFTI